MARVYILNPGRFEFGRPDGRQGVFSPRGRLEEFGEDADKIDLRKNPAAWDSDETLAARIFVGLNDGDVPAYTFDQIVEAVKSFREEKHNKVGASFLAQRGWYLHKDGKHAVEEDAVQIVIIDVWGTPRRRFDQEMIELAEELAAVFNQEEVIVEIQKNGVTQRTIGVVAE